MKSKKTYIIPAFALATTLAQPGAYPSVAGIRQDLCGAVRHRYVDGTFFG